MYNFSAALHVSGQEKKYCWNEKEVLVLLGVSWHFFVGVSWKFKSFFFFWNMYCTLDHMYRKSTHFFFSFAVETLNKGGKTGKGLQRKTEKKPRFYITSIHFATLECAQYTLVALILLLFLRATQGEELQEIFFQVQYGFFDSFNRSARGYGGGTLIVTLITLILSKSFSYFFPSPIDSLALHAASLAAAGGAAAINLIQIYMFDIIWPSFFCSSARENHDLRPKLSRSSSKMSRTSRIGNLQKSLFQTCENHFYEYYEIVIILPWWRLARRVRVEV